MKVRLANVADVQQLANMVRDEFTLQHQIAPAFDFDPAFDFTHYVRQILQSASEKLMVADETGMIIGYVHVRVQVGGSRKAWWSPARSNGWIEDCYVHAGFRRRGVGSMMVREAMSWLKAQRVVAVGLAVWHSNDGARGFWERHGFSPYQVFMQCTIDIRSAKTQTGPSGGY
jgi:ribosomal protein S18 acetylase RimI-like enzyme